MTVLAAEGPGAGGAGAGAGGRGALAGQSVVVGENASKGVLLAIAIVLLWLSGLCFFIAFEGAKILGEASFPGGGGFVKGIITGLANKTLQLRQQGGPALWPRGRQRGARG